MTRQEAIEEIKEAIKSLTAIQIKAKKELRQPHTKDTWSTQRSAWVRAAEITSILNLYNELRGKEYRHSIDKHDCWTLRGINETLSEYQELVREYPKLVRESSVATDA